MELAAIFFYEYYKKNIKVFDDVFISPLAKIIGKTEGIYRIRYFVYKYHLETHKISILTPKKVHDYLKEMIERFPRNIEFLKWFMDDKAQNRFLNLLPGRGYYKLNFLYFTFSKGHCCSVHLKIRYTHYFFSLTFDKKQILFKQF